MRLTQTSSVLFRKRGMEYIPHDECIEKKMEDREVSLHYLLIGVLRHSIMNLMLFYRLHIAKKEADKETGEGERDLRK